MESKDYYKILAIDAEADSKAIKTAYRKLARQFHLDVSKEADAENKFKSVAEAYEVLKDKDKRAQYDELLQYRNAGHGFRPPPGWESANYRRGQSDARANKDFSDFFEAIFGGRGMGVTGETLQGLFMLTALNVGAPMLKQICPFF